MYSEIFYSLFIFRKESLLKTIHVVQALQKRRTVEKSCRRSQCFLKIFKPCKRCSSRFLSLKTVLHRENHKFSAMFCHSYWKYLGSNFLENCQSFRFSSLQVFSMFLAIGFSRNIFQWNILKYLSMFNENSHLWKIFVKVFKF